jgi:hypothetical protein
LESDTCFSLFLLPLAPNLFLHSCPSHCFHQGAIEQLISEHSQIPIQFKNRKDCVWGT